jgi:two-component system, NarL family, sensor histidine kinase DesK
MSTTPSGPLRRAMCGQWWYLAYLGMLLFQPAFDPDAGLADWLVVAAIVALFVPVYIYGTSYQGRRRRWALLASLVLGVAATPVNAGAAVLFVYAAAFAGGLSSRPVVLRWLWAITAVVVCTFAVSPIPLPYRLLSYLPPLVFVWVIGFATMGETQREREATRLRIENHRIQHLATLSERERIARDLHDLLGQSLTALVLRAQLVQRLVATDPQRATHEAQGVEQAARDALREVRTAVSGWRHVSVDTELASALATLQAAGVTAEVDAAVSESLAPVVEVALALALREAVTNVVRHAQANRCRITIDEVDGMIRLVVADDGVGGNAPEGNGLTGMRERITGIGGRVERRARRGTTVTVTAPHALTARTEEPMAVSEAR